MKRSLAPQFISLSTFLYIYFPRQCNVKHYYRTLTIQPPSFTRLMFVFNSGKRFCFFLLLFVGSWWNFKPKVLLLQQRTRERIKWDKFVENIKYIIYIFIGCTFLLFENIMQTINIWNPLEMFIKLCLLCFQLNNEYCP